MTHRYFKRTLPLPAKKQSRAQRPLHPPQAKHPQQAPRPFGKIPPHAQLPLQWNEIRSHGRTDAAGTAHPLSKDETTRAIGAVRSERSTSVGSPVVQQFKQFAIRCRACHTYRS